MSREGTGRAISVARAKVQLTRTAARRLKREDQIEGKGVRDHGDAVTVLPARSSIRSGRRPEAGGPSDVPRSAA